MFYVFFVRHPAMARKTKEEAAATRLLLLDAAERLFSEQGVSNTSLHDIALAAGLTRGAIYWHFENKGELLKAMWERVAMPVRDMLCTAAPATPDPLDGIRRKMCWLADHIEEEPRIFVIMNILMMRCEFFTEETRSVRQYFLDERETRQQRLQADFEAAVAADALPASTDTRLAALGLFGLIDGICFHWLVNPKAFCIRSVTHSSVQAYLTGLKHRN